MSTISRPFTARVPPPPKHQQKQALTARASRQRYRPLDAKPKHPLLPPSSASPNPDGNKGKKVNDPTPSRFYTLSTCLSRE